MKEETEPFEPGRTHVPDYYRLEVEEIGPDGRPTGRIVVTSVQAIIRAAGVDFFGGSVLKYVLRAGKKPGQPEEKDRAKAAESAALWYQATR